MSRDKENLRDSPCEKKFDNSIIRDINPETLRDSPCEERNTIIRDINPETLRDSPCEEKFDNSQIRDNKTVTSAMLRVKINQFANSIIRDKNNPCEE